MSESDLTGGVSLQELFEVKLKAFDDKLTALAKNVDFRFDAGDKAISLAFAALEKATELAATVLNHKLETMNEWQRRMDRMESGLTTRIECDARHSRLDETVKKIDGAVAKLETYEAVVRGMASQKSVWVMGFIAIAGLMLNLVKAWRW